MQQCLHYRDNVNNSNINCKSHCSSVQPLVSLIHWLYWQFWWIAQDLIAHYLNYGKKSNYPIDSLFQGKLNLQTKDIYSKFQYRVVVNLSNASTRFAKLHAFLVCLQNKIIKLFLRQTPLRYKTWLLVQYAQTYNKVLIQHKINLFCKNEKARGFHKNLGLLNIKEGTQR